MVIRTYLDDLKRRRRNSVIPEKMKEIIARVKRNGNSYENLNGE
jgi:hypothetical protein